MSEIKGQVLGIILVLVLFGVISGALTVAFGHYRDKINEEVENTIDPTIPAPSNGYFHY